MGETILFPDDQHRLLKLGEKALAKDDFQQALQYFQDCYQVAPEYTVQKRILFCLEKLGAYRQGLTMAQDHQEAYDRDPEGVDQLLRLYLLDQQYLTARSYLVALEKVQRLSLWTLASGGTNWSIWKQANCFMIPIWQLSNEKFYANLMSRACRWQPLLGKILPMD